MYFKDRSSIANLLKWEVPYICATFDKISIDKGVMWSLVTIQLLANFAMMKTPRRRHMSHTSRLADVRCRHFYQYQMWRFVIHRTSRAPPHLITVGLSPIVTVGLHGQIDVCSVVILNSGTAANPKPGAEP